MKRQNGGAVPAPDGLAGAAVGAAIKAPSMQTPDGHLPMTGDRYPQTAPVRQRPGPTARGRARLGIMARMGRTDYEL